MQSDTLSYSIVHTSSKHVMTFPNDTLRLGTTHPDTYNLVDFSTHPRAVHPRAKCYKCYNVSIPHTQG